MISKKKIGVILSTTILLAFGTGVLSYANESNDTPWTIPKLNWASNQATIYTEVRPKTDTTSGYGNVQWGNAGNSIMAMQLKNTNCGDLTGRYRILPPVEFRGNVHHYVPSNAYENGYRSVRMCITQKATYRPESGGLWSPDSY